MCLQGFDRVFVTERVCTTIAVVGIDASVDENDDEGDKEEEAEEGQRVGLCSDVLLIFLGDSAAPP